MAVRFVGPVPRALFTLLLVVSYAVLAGAAAAQQDTAQPTAPDATAQAPAPQSTASPAPQPATAADPVSLAAAADERVWIVRFIAPNVIRVYYRDADTPAGRLSLVNETTGPAPLAIAADGTSLVIAFEGGAMQSLRYELPEGMIFPQLRAHVMPPVPPAYRVSRLAIGGSGPVAILESFEGADRRLGRLSSGSWTLDPLPPDTAGRRVLGFAVVDPDRSAVAIATDSSAPGSPRLRIDRQTPGEGWLNQTYDLALGQEGLLAAASSNLYALRAEAEPGGRRRLNAHLLRGPTVSEVGDLAVIDSGDEWTVIGDADRLVVVTTGQTTDTASWAARSVVEPWTGAAELQPLELQDSPSLPISQQAILTIAIAVAAVVLIVTGSRGRNPQASLPKGVKPAEGRRLIAGMMDLGLSLAVIMGLQPLIDPGHWQVYGADLAQLLLGFAVVAVHVLHTTIGELFFARSVGKAMWGCRVTDLNGNPPHVWQVLARNAMKAVELLALPLLIWPATNPLRQRIGDQFARTLVVEKEEESTERGE